MSIAVLPYNIQLGSSVQLSFVNSAQESESGITNPLLIRPDVVRIYTLTIGPDVAPEAYTMFLAASGKRYPVAMRDWINNYQLIDEPQVFTIVGGNTVVKLTRTFTPVTGTFEYIQRILIIDINETPFTMKVNGSPLTSGVSWAITDPGILTIHTALSSGDTLTVTGDYLTAVYFIDDSLEFELRRVKGADCPNGVFISQSAKFREILEQDLIQALNL